MVTGYENFTGTLVSIRGKFFNRSAAMLTLRNSEGSLRVELGLAGAMGLTPGKVYIVGHIDKKVVNIRLAKGNKA